MDGSSLHNLYQLGNLYNYVNQTVVDCDFCPHQMYRIQDVLHIRFCEAIQLSISRYNGVVCQGLFLFQDNASRIGRIGYIVIVIGSLFVRIANWRLDQMAYWRNADSLIRFGLFEKCLLEKCSVSLRLPQVFLSCTCVMWGKHFCSHSTSVTLEG